ncbi:uncharacterized protein EV420DRAFT_255213 [Desarmillaria tabescens]|uniref:Uncharacterized protein n=1 Tax=Armillaria tabescens TaxID=1929756 RepID=A0AA39KFF3_ARMTA|nr:uncharacterized protein EV420DRAFT_255213 [Desarmillaria tabescens]KAK0460191.1 hypothetical protein EV420DRAFT_255213 [Desarmillaria tabescens]
MFMEQKGNPLSSRLRLVITFLAASTVFTAICATITCNQFQASQAIRSKIKSLGENSKTQNYSYLGHDYPQEWNVPGLTDSEVYVYVGNSEHYALDTEPGISEWDRLLPPGGGMVHLGPNQRPFSISIFHQLRCLNIIRGGLTDSQKTADPKLLQHCMNYLRQMVLCRADSQLQSVRRSTGGHVTSWSQPRVCRNWKMVYDATEANFREYDQDITGL